MIDEVAEDFRNLILLKSIDSLLALGEFGCIFSEEGDAAFLYFGRML